MNRWSLVASGCCVAASLVLSSCDIGSVGSAKAATFANPIMNGGADPWMIQHDGYYYYTHTVGNAIQIWKSRSLTDMAGAETAVIWKPPATGPNSADIWAPELHWFNGKWYIYYAADDGRNENHRMFVLESATDDALGEYEDRGKITDSTDKWAIDGTVLSKPDGSLYFIWSGWEGDVNVSQRLYIAPMSNPYTISGDRVELSRPTLDWEMIGEPTINEGPEVLVSDKKINLIYSASGSWTDDYTLGLLTADPGSDPLDPASWTKKPEPVFKKTDRVFGPGHNSFVKSPDGKEDWIVYHAAITSGAGWNRNVRTQPFQWNEDGTPDFGEPVAPGAWLPLPSGEPARMRLEAEKAKLEGMQATENEEASGGKIVSGWTDEDSGVEWEIEVEKDGVYRLALRYLNEASVPQHLNMTIGGKLHVDVSLDTGLKGEWSNAFIPVGLKKGSNTIKLGGGGSRLSLDSIDVLAPEE
ncbi:family 43 glycosylhydrolase [Paenibacillus rhizovicinus]|uniref:Family 43 glycosylhydrolase n=1 Tax=Paenibacillus rhizovicinus TaxID=2704463 RepID=A0A6C0P042_9BACL|nr:family 43 glycosylhydrolase [Paenibacillus rhizovicinus]QHW31890.1 family 43 glycosylhydrolase [Paenibacillus rhizovicinus]